MNDLYKYETLSCSPIHTFPTDANALVLFSAVKG